MKYARVPFRNIDGEIITKVVKGKINIGAFEIEHDLYPPRIDDREMRVVEIINEKEYFKAILNGEG